MEESEVNENLAPPDLHPPGMAEPPEVSDTLGGWVWVVLFGLIMGISVMANLMMCASVLSQPKKRHNMVYWLLMLLFGLNLVDYGLLIFEFTLGIEHQYPHGRQACAVYQTMSKGNPVIQAAVVIILAYYAANHYSSVSSPGCSNHQNGLKMALVISGLSVLFGLLALPTANFADIVKSEGKRYCEISIPGASPEEAQINISVYYLFYSSILSYWIPLMVSIPALIILVKLKNSDKYPEVTVVLATISSFFFLYFLHASIVILRHTLDAMSIEVNPHQMWVIKVAQSLLWLLAFFWHVTRPLLAILIDPDLPLNGCCGSKSSGTGGSSRPVELFDLVEEAAPLREVIRQPLSPQPFKSKSEMMMKNSDEDANHLHSTLDV